MTAVLTGEMPEPDSSPPFSDAKFEALIRELVTDDAPRLFAVVEEYGDREDAHVGAWGLAFPDHAEVVTAEGTLRMRVQSPDSTLRFFLAPNVTARVVWIDGLGDDSKAVAG